MNDNTSPDEKRIRLRSGIELPAGAFFIRAEVRILMIDPETGRQWYADDPDSTVTPAKMIPLAPKP